MQLVTALTFTVPARDSAYIMLKLQKHAEGKRIGLTLINCLFPLTRSVCKTMVDRLNIFHACRKVIFINRVATDQGKVREI